MAKITVMFLLKTMVFRYFFLDCAKI